MRKQVGQASVFANGGLKHEFHALVTLPQIAGAFAFSIALAAIQLVPMLARLADSLAR